MRQDEIAQLHLDDIRQDEEGIWLIDVNDRGDKKVKTKSARRLIPIHPFIANELRLPDYVEGLKGQGETRLFPELKKGHRELPSHQWKQKPDGSAGSGFGVQTK